jgi:multiple sugar transport system substrate-binding protein
MNRTSRLLLVMVLVAVLVGPSLTVTAQDDVTVVQLWTRTTSLFPAIDAFNAEMEAEGQDLRIEYTFVENADFPTKFTTALAAGEAPDVVSIDLVLVPYYNSIGAFMDLTDKYEALEYKDTLNPAMLNLGTADGHVYALPFGADVSALIYNRALFETAGLDPDAPPTTWAELRADAEALTTGDVYGYGFSGGSPGGLMFTMMPYAWANGGQWLNEDGTTAELDDPKTVEAVQFFVDMINDGLVPPGTATYSYDDFQNGFKQEKIAMMTTGNFVVSDLTTNFPEIDFGVALIPGQDGESFSAFAGGDLIAIPNGAKHLEEAWKVIEFMLSDAIQVEVFAKNGQIPVRSDLYDNAYFEAEPRYQVFAKALTVAYVPYTTVYNELYDPFLVGMQNAFTGEKPVEEALADATKDMQAVLDRSR